MARKNCESDRDGRVLSTLYFFERPVTTNKFSQRHLLVVGILGLSPGLLLPSRAIHAPCHARNGAG
jgi:hypothetical protein